MEPAIAPEMIAATPRPSYVVRVMFADGEVRDVDITPLEEMATRLEDERKRSLTRSLFWEEAGVWVFIVGLLMSTIGALD